MTKDYFFLYLIYGLAFINIGIFSIQEKDKEVTNLPLVKSLKYLGYFGFSHGISEWITMVTITDLYPDLIIPLFIIKQLLKAISFAFLIFFGISLLPIKTKYKSIVYKIPIFIFSLWFIIFISLISYFGQDYHILNPKYNTVVLRYLMAFSGGTISAIALYLNAKIIEKSKSNKIAKRYKSLAYIFLIYGFLDGFIVKEMGFFPANMFNNKLFLEIFRCPTQIVKTAVGVTINFILIKVIDTFGWEQKERLKQLEKHRIASEERRKLGLEIHDSIIQGLYASGLKLEYLMKNKEEYKSEPILQEIKIELKNTMDKTREFLSSTALDIIDIEDLKSGLQQLVEKFNGNQSIQIKLNYEISSLNSGQLSSEKSTQIYYILQEAISNVIKHSNATYAEILLEAKYNYLYIRVIDNGIGISIKNLNTKKQFGINSMKERTKRIRGTLNIEKIKKGTSIELTIPWEESIYEG